MLFQILLTHTSCTICIIHRLDNSPSNMIDFSVRTIQSWSSTNLPWLSCQLPTVSMVCSLNVLYGYLFIRQEYKRYQMAPLYVLCMNHG